jgi:hypothetical protein
MERENQNPKRKQPDGETGEPVQLSEEQLTALANQVAKSLKAKELKIIASNVARSLKPKDFVLVGKTLGKSPVFWICMVFGLVSVCLTAWKAVPHFVKEKAQTVFNQEITNQIRLQFQEPRISNILVAVASGEASALMKQQVSPAIEKFERGLGEKETEIQVIQSNLTNIQRTAETNLTELRLLGETYALVVAAQSGDRAAFWKVFATSRDANHSMHELAQRSTADIIDKVVLAAALTDTGTISLKDVVSEGPAFKPDTASLEEYKRLLYGGQFSALTGIGLIRAFYSQARFPLDERLAMVAWFVKHHNSLLLVEASCKIMDREARLGKNFMGANDYLSWYENWATTNKAKAK